MRETYKKEDFKEALFSCTEDDSFMYILTKGLIEAKLKRLNIEHREMKEMYEDTYLPIINRNIGKDTKEYDISQVLVEKINNFVKKFDKLTIQINYYVECRSTIYNSGTLKKRKKLIAKLIRELK